MLKNLFLFLMLSTFSFAQAETLEGVVTLHGDPSYFVLSNGQCYVALPFNKRWRTPSEWWNDVQIAEEYFDTDPADWQPGSRIDIYSIKEFAIPFQNASNSTYLKQCTSVFINNSTGKVLLAYPISIVDCLLAVYQRGLDDGYVYIPAYITVYD